LRRALGGMVGRPPDSWWKLNKYRQGDEVTVPIDGFFP
jgi:hypothetical protein